MRVIQTHNNHRLELHCSATIFSCDFKWKITKKRGVKILGCYIVLRWDTLYETSNGVEAMKEWKKMIGDGKD